MKKLFALMPLVISFSLIGMEPLEPELKAGQGVWVVNRTGSPVVLSWYKTRVALGVGLKKYAWGEKKQIPGYKFSLNDQDRVFVTFPPQQPVWDKYSVRRELMLTYNPDLLIETIGADNSGVITDEKTRQSLLVVDKDSLPTPYDITAQNTDQIFLQKPVGTNAITIEKGKELEEVAQKPGWTFENKSDQTVYCGWYQTRWDKVKKAYVDPELMQGQQVVPIRPGGRERLPFPEKLKYGQRQLLVSFNQALLSPSVKYDEQNNPPKGVIARDQHELKPINSTWQIFSEEGTPYLVPFTYLIGVINTTNNPLYAAMYYIKDGKAIKWGPRNLVIDILPQLSNHIQYPPAEKGSVIQLLIAAEQDKQLLQQSELSSADINRLYAKDFSQTNIVNWYFQGDYSILTDISKEAPYNFKLTSVGGGAYERLPKALFDIRAFNPTEINLLEDRFRENDPLFRPAQQIIDVAHNVINPIIKDINSLDLEQEFVKNRLERARGAINKFLGQDLIPAGGKVPRIALVFTGGGYRAMTEAIGFLRGADKVGLLDCITYMTGLSGSTWAINPLVASGKSPQAFSDEQRLKVNRGEGRIGSLPMLLSEVIKNPSYIQRRFIESRFGQYHGPIGLYGHSLVNVLLEGISVNDKTAHDITLSDLRTNLANYRYPLPLSVAVDPGERPDGSDRVWYEFSPFYSGTRQERGSWVDSMLFGSIFNRGIIKQYVPEYPLGQYMGIWGSAFSVTADDIGKASTVGGYLATAINSLGAGVSSLYNLALWKSPVPSECPVGRTSAGQIPNPIFQGGAAPRLNNSQHLCLIDGGITKQGDYRHNFASIPALWREVDILIMCDSTGKPNRDLKSDHLIGASEEAASLGYPFPQIHRGSVHREALENIPNTVSTLFVEAKAPVVVYMKGQKNKEYAEKNPFIPGFDPDQGVSLWTESKNFNYTPVQFDALSGLAEHIMSDQKTVDNIKEALRIAIARK